MKREQLHHHRQSLGLEELTYVYTELPAEDRERVLVVARAFLAHHRAH